MLIWIYIITLIRKRKKHYLLFENRMALPLNKLEFPSPKDALCQVWFKLAQQFWRRRFLNFINIFLLIRNFLPVKGRGLHLNKFASPSSKNTLCQVWLKLAKCSSEEEEENMKSLRKPQAIRKAHLSFQFKWAKNSLKAFLDTVHCIIIISMHIFVSDYKLCEVSI